MEVYPVRHTRKKCGKVAAYLIRPFGAGGRLPVACVSCGRRIKAGELDFATAIASKEVVNRDTSRRVKHFHAKGSIVTEVRT